MDYAIFATKGFKNGCEVTLKIFRFSIGLIMVQNLVLILRKPSSTILFTSLLSDEYIRRLLYRLPLTLLQCEVWMSMMAYAMLYMAILYLYAFPTVFALKEMIP